MDLSPRSYFFVALALIAGFLIPGWRRIIGATVFCVGFPALFHLLRHDGEANPWGYAMMLAGFAEFIAYRAPIN